MEHLRCPACGDRGYVGKDLTCNSCQAQLEWDGPERLRLPVRKASRRWPLAAASFLLGGLLMGGAALMFQGAQVDPPAPPSPPPAVQTGRPQLDVVFVVDSTGSMADEIDVVKDQVRSMIRKVQSGQPRPDVRCGVVTFRDRGDEYVTRSWQLTEDLDKIDEVIQALEADAGGDTPESVNEALHAAVSGMDWNPDPTSGKVLFLIGDAAPHMDYPDDYDYRTELSNARQKGIKVHTWGCSGIVESGEREFRDIAQLGAGDFEFLTYRQEVVKSDGTRSHVVFQGAEAYEQTDSAADWKKGARRMESAGEVKALPKSSVAAPGAYGAGSYKDGSYRPASEKLENNLDRVLTEQVMQEAEARGTRY